MLLGVRNMTLTTDKTRISLYLDNDLKEWVAKEAKKKNRSMSNYIETILEQIKKGGLKVDI
jgi:pantothenate synthetase